MDFKVRSIVWLTFTLHLSLFTAFLEPRINGVTCDCATAVLNLQLISLRCNLQIVQARFAPAFLWLPRADQQTSRQTASILQPCRPDFSQISVNGTRRHHQLQISARHAERSINLAHCGQLARNAIVTESQFSSSAGEMFPPNPTIAFGSRAGKRNQFRVGMLPVLFASITPRTASRSPRASVFPSSAVDREVLTFKFHKPSSLICRSRLKT